jgi:hypothetical protein
MVVSGENPLPDEVVTVRLFFEVLLPKTIATTATTTMPPRTATIFTNRALARVASVITPMVPAWCGSCLSSRGDYARSAALSTSQRTKLGELL